MDFLLGMALTGLFIMLCLFFGGLLLQLVIAAFVLVFAFISWLWEKITKKEENGN